MASTTQDNEIRIELDLKARPEKVWSAVSTAEGFTAWFCEDIYGSFEVGKRFTLVFGQYGECEAEVVERNEGHSFAYRWHPGDVGTLDQFPMEEATTVRFELSSAGEGTRLVLTETGFAQISPARRLSALKSDTEGWTSEIKKLVDLANEDKAQPWSFNEIHRQRVYGVGIQKVWDAVATQQGLAGWFVDAIEGELAVGEVSVWDFGTSIRGAVKVVDRTEPEAFGFRWHVGVPTGVPVWETFPERESVVVRFKLSQVPDGTKLEVSETGYENVPEDRRMIGLKMNKRGWSMVMDMIGEYLGKNG